MKKTKHTPEQIIAKLRRVEALAAEGATVAEAAREIGVSERWACKTLGQPRSTQRYPARKPDKDRSLVRRMHQLSEQNPRFGYRRITRLLRREGWRAGRGSSGRGLVNQKRVHRLWKLAGLQVPRRQRKRRRLAGTSEDGCARLRASYPGHVWSIDFLFDTTEEGRQVKFMPVLDEYTRECLVIDARAQHHVRARRGRAQEALCGARRAAGKPALGQRPGVRS